MKYNLCASLQRHLKLEPVGDPLRILLPFTIYLDIVVINPF